MELPMTKNPSLFPGQWGIPGSDSPLGFRMEPTTVVRFVSSTHALASNLNDGTDPNFPLATLGGATGAISKSIAGDWIILAQGHVEAVIAAGTITVNVAGLTVVGLGEGARRPTFNFTTSAAASLLITSAGLHLENVLCVSGIDSLTNPIHIQAADVTLKNVEWRDSTNAIEALRAILTTAAADRLNIDGFIYDGWATGDACVNAIRLVGVDVCEIANSRFQGLFSTGIVEFITTLSSKVMISNCLFRNGATATLAKNVVNTGALACTWELHSCYDAVASKIVFGGSGVGGMGFRTDTGDYALEKADGACLAGQDDLFVVSGGPILVTELYGICTGAPGGASQMHLDAAVVSPAADVPLSTDVAIDAIVAGGLITFSVAAPGVLTITAVGALEAAPATRWVIPPSTIKAHGGTARAACVIHWYLHYYPLSVSSVVTIAV